jgi:hypothetical protein
MILLTMMMMIECRFWYVSRLVDDDDDGVRVCVCVCVHFIKKRT